MMRRAWLILIALALPAARQERLQLTDLMVDTMGRMVPRYHDVENVKYLIYTTMVN